MSEIFVDTIRKTGGSLGTDIRIKNTSVYESDGGTSVTQNIVQGLAKHWVRLDGSGTISALDSFNNSGVTDHGNGSYTFAFTNNMNNVNYSVQLTASVDHTVDFFFATIGDESGSYTPPATTGYRSHNCGSAGSTGDTDHVCGTVNGDLA